LSETKQPSPQSAADANQPPPATSASQSFSAEPGAGHGPEAWLSLAIGAFLLLMYPRFLQWLSSRVFHTHFNEFQLEDGTIVPYTQVPEFWMDLGPVLFGIVLILDGIVLLATRSRRLLAIAFVLTIVATAYNAVYVVGSYARSGFAPISFLAAVFGIYIAWSQWRTLQMTRVAVVDKQMPPARE